MFTRQCPWKIIPAALFCWAALVLIGCGVESEDQSEGEEGSRPEAQDLDVTTGLAFALGRTSLTLSGTIHPHGGYATYYFEYGATPDYGSRTVDLELPPRLAAYYAEGWDQHFSGWQVYYDCESQHFTSGGASGGYIRVTDQDLLNDFNHEASGALHLMTGMNTGPVNDPSVMLGGGDPDLRDAEVSLSVRGRDWVPNGSEFVCWLQSQSNIELLNEKGWRRANWAFVGTYLTQHLLKGDWQETRWVLHNDPAQWSYGGHNPIQQGPKADRYEYWSINESLAHWNCNFLLLSAFVTPSRPPSGAIDFDSLEIKYRNHSLLVPSNGGRFESAPDSPGQDPATLTDGWRHGADRMWRSGAHPSRPQEIVYSFQKEVTIEGLQLHQNPEWPTKEVQVQVSGDGASYTEIARATLPESSDHGPNYAYSSVQNLSANALYLKVRLLSGYQSQHWGLGEIEVFGSGAQKLPEDAPCPVNTDVHDLVPGETVYYRLVAENETGISHGLDQRFEMPEGSAPLVETGTASRITTTTARLEGRINPRGTTTYYYFQYGTDTNYGDTPFENPHSANVGARRHGDASSGIIYPPVPGTYGGLQITPRTVLTHLAGLKPGTTYHYRLVAHNPSGPTYGEDALLITAPRK